MCEIDGNESRRQKSGWHLLASAGVLVDVRSRVALDQVFPIGIEFVFADSREAVIGSNEEIGFCCQPWGTTNEIKNLLEICVSVFDGCHGSGTVDTGSQLVETVALVMLGAVRISTPKTDNERFARFEETRYNRFLHA